MRASTVLSSLNGALHEIMQDTRTVLMGEDLLDPYGGAFKVSKGLSTAYPARVLTTPISEAGFTGVAVGMAMRGMRPIVEIMFGDFVMLAADQILNHATKYPFMYDGKASVPIVIRTPMGGRRGYGPTHSQSVEKHLFGVPGLTVLAPHPYLDPGALLRHAVLDDDGPVLFVENKLMYSRPLRLAAEDGRIGDLYARSSGGPTPCTTLSYDGFAEADLTLVTYGGMVEMAVGVAERLLLEEEVVAEVVAPSSLAPLELGPVLDSLSRTGRLLVCEESTPVASFGSELLARVAVDGFGLLRAAPRRVSARDIPIANTRTLEDAILPQEADLFDAALALSAVARGAAARVR